MQSTMEQSSYFEYDKKSFDVAVKAVKKFTSEHAILEYLVESRPPFLKIGDSLMGVDTQGLSNDIKGIADKLRIHGYFDRGDRLMYLYDILRSKFSDQDDVFKITIKFLMDMSQRPTSVIHLDVPTTKYSPLPDGDESEEDSSEKQRRLLLEIFGDFKDDAVSVSYSTGSELSEWSDDESEPSKHSNNDIALPNRNMRLSRSFGEFSDAPLKPDLEEVTKEMQMYWSLECVKASNFLNSDVREVIKIPLRQPVISGLLSLHANFGEYREWKNNTQSRKLNVVSEYDVIREIVWQFSAVNNKRSPIFSESWDIKTDLIVSSITRMSFLSLMKKFKSSFIALNKFKIFVDRIENEPSSSERPSFKVFLSYANAISELVMYIRRYVCRLEAELKPNAELEDDVFVCTTLVRLENRLEPVLKLISVMDDLYTLTIEKVATLQPDDEWVSSIYIVSILAKSLAIQSTPPSFGVLLFLFSRVLAAFLDDMTRLLTTLSWKNEDSIFTRDNTVRISDPNFWSDAIQLRDVESKLKECGITPLRGLLEFICGFHVVLKTSEMLNQMNEDFVLALGIPPVPSAVVDEFLRSILPNFDQEKTETIHPAWPDYKMHLKFIGLECSFVADSVKSIVNKQTNTKCGVSNYFKLDNYVTLDQVPSADSWEALLQVFRKRYGPIFEKSKKCISAVTAEFKVDESVQIFREIILGLREEYALQMVELAKPNTSTRFGFEDEMSRNPRFQKLLTDLYPVGRDNFTIDFKLDKFSDVEYNLLVTPKFPLNLILTQRSIDSYLFVSSQLQKIRKSLWEVTALRLKDVKTLENIEPNRALLFRFALLHFCSNIRAYLVFRILSKDHRIVNNCSDLDVIRRAHEEHLNEIQTKLFGNHVMERVIIRKMLSMSKALDKYWSKGICCKTMVLLEDTLLKCWNVVRTFPNLDELSGYLGPPPVYLKV